MNYLDVLLKSISLLYRENKLLNFSENNSKDVVREVLELINKNRNKYRVRGIETEIIDNLSVIANSMSLEDHGIEYYNTTNLSTSIELVVKKDRPEVLSFIKNSIMADIGKDEGLELINSTRSYLNKFIRQENLKNSIDKAHFQLNSLNSSSLDLDKFLMDLSLTLEKISSINKDDPSITTELDFSDTEHLAEICDSALSEAVGGDKLTSGWHRFNKMTGGGIARGEFVMIPALQHNYKSGLLNSLFIQTAMYNTPKPSTNGKKPLLILFSLEDKINISLMFIYKYLYYLNNGKLPNREEITGSELGNYIKEHLTKTGFEIKIIKVDPTDWTYKSFFNKVMYYERDYEIYSIFFDYLMLMPTTGCRNDGPAGTDLRDLCRRVRNFCGSRNIAFVTSWQLSPRAKEMIRNGTPESTFVKLLGGKGYFSGSTQLDQEIDLEIYCHVCKIRNKYYLSIARGKHRGSDIIDDKLKYFLLPFPDLAPVMPDIDKEDSSYNPEEDEDSFGF